VPPAAAVFDNDGLFLDTEAAWTRAEVRLFTNHGEVFTDAHKADLIGSSHLVAAGKLEVMLGQPGNGVALMDELHDLVMEEALGEVAPRPGALELLDRLDAAGVPTGLASNSPREFLERVLGSAGVPVERFGVVLSAHDVGAPKPAPDVYLAACAALGADPAASVGLEDSPPGVQAAKAAGMTVVGVPYLESIQLPEADLLVRSLADPAVHRLLGVA
jgi:HAD superfamily hydrolase (TIGR01509 family)